MNKELKQCPFCGGDAFQHIDYFSLGRKFLKEKIVCKDCWASTQDHYKENKAIAAWNERA